MSIADILFQRNKEKAAKNLQEGQAFLEENKKRTGVIETSTGLQYEVLQYNEGEKPSAESTVTCHYHGTTINGVVFDSSVKRNAPATFPLNRVIKGWTEGLQLMPKGSKFRFFIPPHLAYGERHVSAEIQPNSTLIFDVELIDFEI